MLISGRDALDADMQTGRHKHSAFSLSASIRVHSVRFLTSPISDYVNASFIKDNPRIILLIIFGIFVLSKNIA